MVRHGVEQGPALTTPESEEGAYDAVTAAAPEELRSTLAVDRNRMIEQLRWVRGASSVLDIGGGYGAFAPSCAALGKRAVLVDNFEPYSTLRRDQGDRLRGWLEGLGVEVHSLDAVLDPLPFPDDVFDAVTSFDSIEHWHHSPRSLFAEVRRVGRPGALFVIGVPNAVNLRKRLAVLAGRTNWSRFEDWYEPTRFAGHVREPVVADLARIADDMGLRDVRIIGRNWLGYFGGRGRRLATTVLDPLLRLRPHLCADIYLLGRLPD